MARNLKISGRASSKRILTDSCGNRPGTSALRQSRPDAAAITLADLSHLTRKVEKLWANGESIVQLSHGVDYRVGHSEPKR